MIRKFYIDTVSRTVEEAEVDRETDNSVWVRGKRRKKVGHWYGYFDSGEEALDWLLNVLRKNRDKIEADVYAAKEKYAELSDQIYNVALLKSDLKKS